jgi:hypothetical protein
MMRIFLMVWAAALLAACAGQPPDTTSTPTPSTPAPTTRPPTAASPGINLTGYSPAFRAGYADGCSSVDAAARRRDDARFKAEPDYAQGWRDGNDICKRKK